MTFGLKLLKNEEIPRFGDSFCLMQICSILLIGTSCALYIFTTAIDLSSGFYYLGSVLYSISLWYVPKLYSEKERAQTKVNARTLIYIVVGLAIAWCVLWVVNNIINSPSHRPDEPWRELGVTKKEYMEVYNFYKYGEWVG